MKGNKANPMVIIVDSREQRPFDFAPYSDVVTEKGTLSTGDYSVKGFEHIVAVERKSLNDLVGCLMGANRDRFVRELVRARGLKYFTVVVEANFSDLVEGKYRSKMIPQAAAQSVFAFSVRYNIPFIFAGTPDLGAYMTYSLLGKFLKEEMSSFNNIVNNLATLPDMTNKMDANRNKKEKSVSFC